MKFFYEILIVIIMIIALLAFVLKSYIIAIIGIVAFLAGCFIEYLINRNKNENLL